MRLKTAVSSLCLCLMVAPVMAHADTSLFARDRNAPVGTRIPASYEPLGINIGAFNLRPLVEFGLEANDNVLYSNTNTKSSAIFSVAPSFTLNSNWGRHALSAALGTTYSNYTSASSENTLEANASVGGRYDIQGDSNLFAGANISQNYEPRYDPFFPLDPTKRLNEAAKPIKYNTTFTNAGFVAVANRLRFKGEADYTKFDYFDVKSINGSMIDQDYRDYASVELSGRVDYAVSPDTSVYVVYTGNHRDYRVDNTRNSHGYDYGLGASFDLTSLVTGEVQYGYLHQTYKNPLFKPTKGPSFAGKVQYFPTRLMTITLKTAKAVEETPQLTASGYLDTDTFIGVDHELLRTLILSASYDHTSDKYEGIDRHDKRGVLSLGGHYFLSRNLTLKAYYSHSEFKSVGTASYPGYKDNALRVSLDVQY